MSRIALTKITSTKPQTLTKRCTLKNGKLERSTVASMSEGRAEVIELDTPAQFASVLEGLAHNEALCYGLAPSPAIRLLSKAQYEAQGKPADTTTRSKDAFSWNSGGGVLLLDYDPQDGQTALSRVQLLDKLRALLPSLDATAYVWWASSSSLIFNTETQEQLTPIKGQRVYIFVQDAGDIERAGAVLFKRLWLAGEGFYAISQAGALLERSIIDASVWQTNRLDFAAGAKCIAPLEQRRGSPIANDGEPLDTRLALPDLSEAENADFAAKQAQARAAVRDESAAVQQAYIEEQAIELLTATGKEQNEENLDAAKETIRRALSASVLAGDFLITLADGNRVSVGEVLDNPSKYHHAQTLDPLEPEYEGGKITGKLYLFGSVKTLHSFAHGGRTFKLIRQLKRVQHIGGNTAGTAQEVIDFLRELPDIYDHGQELAQVRDGRMVMLNKDSLGFYLGSVAMFWTWADDKEKRIDPSDRLTKQILSLGEARKLKPLKAVITAPIIDFDGRIISKAGYDKKTGLFLELAEELSILPVQPTAHDVRAALDTLMQPFAGFQTASPLDRSVLLCAILTAIVRPILPTAPAFGFDAPTQGTGKTYLAQCLGALATGAAPAVMPHTAGRDDEETRKRIYSVLLAGDAVLVWDNILGYFDSAAMAALMTSEVYADRKLGVSEKSALPNRLLVFLTGNNLTLAGDMPSRVLKLRLDTQMENPATRKFSSNPLRYIQQHRQTLVMAGLTIIKAYLASDAHQMGGVGAGGTRFPHWDSLARQPVAWLNQALGVEDYPDPAIVLEEAANNDPEKETQFQALSLIDRAMGAGWWTTRELVQRMNGGGFCAQPSELEEVLQDLAGNTKPLTARGLGRVLSYRVGRIAGGLRLLKRDTTTVASFKVERCSSAA